MFKTAEGWHRVPGRDFNEKNQRQITHHYSGNHYFGHFDVRYNFFVLQPSAKPHL